MAKEVVEALEIKADGAYVDATFGRGGHAEVILEKLGPGGRLIAIDRDPEAVASAQERFADDVRFSIVRGSFSMLEQHVSQLDLVGRIDGVLLDLGVSSPQLDDASRGFSFLADGPLDMRMDPQSGRPARDWLEHASESEIAEVIRRYSDERFARRIARAIVNERVNAPIETTRQLAQIVANAVPRHEPGKHPATRTFQAIRIHVNRELEELTAVLPQAVAILAVGGRLVVLSFHSLEDRIVKRFMRDQARGDIYPPEIPVPASSLAPKIRLIGKARYPSAQEIDTNPRARSAVLRAAERIGGAHA